MTAVNGAVRIPPPLLPLVPLAAPPAARHGAAAGALREPAAAPAAKAAAAVPSPPPPARRDGPRRWPLLVIGSAAAVAIWSGWVALGGMCGFGLVQPFPGIVPWHLDTAITLPVSMEAYGAYALGAWLSPGTPRRARRFARWSAAGSLALGTSGQVIYHLLAAAHRVRAPWPVVTLVSCIPVAALGMAAALAHLLRDGGTAAAPSAAPATADAAAAVTPSAEPLPVAAAAPLSPPPPARRDGPPRRPAAVPARRRGGRRERAPKRGDGSQYAAAVAALAENPGLTAAGLVKAAGVSESTARRAKKGQAAGEGPAVTA